MEYTNLEEKWIIVDGLPIFYRQSTKTYAPETPALLHLHGFAISGSYLIPSADVLAADYPTYVPDLPGFGCSIAPKSPLPLPQLADSAVAFMDAIGLEHAVVIANSMGCIVTIEMARKYPDRVMRSILCAPAGGEYNLPWYKGVLQLAWDGIMEPKKKMYLVAIPDYIKYGLLNMLPLAKSMFSYPTQEEAAKLTEKTLVVIGERDPLVSEEFILQYSTTNDNLVVVRIDGSAHALNYSHPDEFSNIVRSFLNDQPIVDDPDSSGTVVMIDPGYLGQAV